MSVTGAQRYRPNTLIYVILFASLVAGLTSVVAPVYGLIAITSLIFIAALFFRPDLGLLALVVTTPFISIANIPLFSFGGQTAPLTPNDILLPIVIAGWLARKLMTGRLHVDRIARWAFAFVVMDIISLAVNIVGMPPNQFMIASLYLIRWFGYMLIYLVVRDTLEDEERIRRFVHALVGSGVLVAFLGFLQLRLLPNVSQITAIANRDVAALQSLDLHQGRLVSVFLEPNHLSGYFLIYIAVCFSFAFAATSRRSASFWFCLLALFLAATVLTQSRAAFLGIAAMALVFNKGRFGLAPLILIGIVSISMLLTSATYDKMKGMFYSNSPSAYGVSVMGIRLRLDGSAYLRMLAWREAIRTVEAYPVVGCGYNAYRFAAAKANKRPVSQSRGGAGAANSYLTILATTGVIGLIVYLGLIWNIVRHFSRVAESHRHSLAAILSFAVVGAMTGLAVHALSIESLFFPQIMFTIWALAGAASAASKLRIGAQHGRS